MGYPTRFITVYGCAADTCAVHAAQLVAEVLLQRELWDGHTSLAICNPPAVVARLDADPRAELKHGREFTVVRS